MILAAKFSTKVKKIIRTNQFIFFHPYIDFCSQINFKNPNLIFFAIASAKGNKKTEIKF